MAIKEYDVFVIGTGSAGKTVAFACANAGLKVAIADDREFGGVCANRGCDPKKVLVGLTDILQRSEDMIGHGLVKLPKPDWSDLQTFKRTFTDPVPSVNEKKLKEAGIALYHQPPIFLDKNTLSVEGKTIKVKNTVIAAGQRPMEFDFPGAELALKSENFLSLESLPKSMLFIGGGFIGMELAHIAARFGVEVSMVHSEDRPLNDFDEDMVDRLVSASRERGIKFFFGAKAHKIEKLRKYYQVTANQDGKKITAKAEMVINTAGRVPSVGKLQLDKGGVSFSKSGIEVNAKMQNPGNKNVYACGDVANSPGKPLTPLASFEAAVVVSQLLDKTDKREAEYPVQPSAVFTLPQLAAVGVKEADAKKKGLDVLVKQGNAEEWYSAKRIRAGSYAFKIVIEKDSGRIIGAHLIGPEAAEMINLFVLAINGNMTVKELKHQIFTYPTWGMDMLSMI